jgi:serine/threonine-protein kinase
MKRFLRILWRLTKAATLSAAFLAGAVGVALLALWLTVNRHFEESEVTVPAITGLSVEDAEERLALADLVLRIEARRPHETVPLGQVYFQEPLAETHTRRKRQVRAYVSSGPRRNVVPNLGSQSSRAAILNLGQLGLSAGEIVRVHSANAPGNAVLAQEPPADARVADDARVDLLVSRGPRRPAYVMPDLRGHSLAEVELVFAGSGLRLAEVTETVLAGVEGGHVASQRPSAGSRVSAETAISLVVARRVEVAPSRFDAGPFRRFDSR